MCVFMFFNHCFLVLFWAICMLITPYIWSLQLHKDTSEQKSARLFQVAKLDMRLKFPKKISDIDIFTAWKHSTRNVILLFTILFNSLLRMKTLLFPWILPDSVEDVNIVLNLWLRKIHSSHLERLKYSQFQDIYEMK